MLARSLAVLFLLSANPSVARALPGVGFNDTVWVDPVLGDDSNASADPGSPFRTIGAAAAFVEFLVPQGERYIRLVSGEYSQASGESYPISLQRGTRLSGISEIAQAQVMGFGLLIEVSPEAGIDRALFENVTFRGLASPGSISGVAIQYENPGAAFADIERVEVHGCRFENLGRGIRAEDAIVTDSVFTDVQWGLTGIIPIFHVVDCTFQGFETAIEVGNVEFTTTNIDVSGSRFLGGVTGISMGLSYNSAVDVEISTSRFEGLDEVLHASELFAPNNISVDALLSNSVFTANGAIMTTGFQVDTSIQMQHCTLDGQGAIASPFPVSGPDAQMQSCISVGHTDRDDGFLQPQDSYLQSSAFIGASGNFTAAEPGFVDVGARDYRLHAASVCVDRGGATSQASDYRGLVRLVDGDLDGQVALDPGAHELQTLIVPESVRLGNSYRLELNGPPGQAFLLMLSRTGLGTSNSLTAYGVFSLPLAATSTRILSSAFPAGGPAAPSYSIAAEPSLVGNRYAFQALTLDAALPGGGAWGQAGELIVLP